MARNLQKLADLQGLIPNELGVRLYEMAKQVPAEYAIVEIGSYHGKSTAHLAAGATDGSKPPVYAVDPWSERVSAWRSSVMDTLPSPDYGVFDAQLKSVRLRKAVTAVQNTSAKASDEYSGPPIGLLYIDGDHSQRAATLDYTTWSRYLADDAVVAWDDYGTRTNPGVKKAVQALLKRGVIADLEVHGRLAVARHVPPKRAKLSVTIMAHPVRKESAEELQAALGGDVTIVYDANPVPSKDPKQRWATGKAAWEAHDPDADWHMVIQDDAIPSKDMIAGLEYALGQFDGEGLVSAYTGTGRPDQKNVKMAIETAEKHKYSWISTWSLNWGVAIIAPTSTIPAMLKWCSRPARSERNYDMRIGQYYRDILGWRTWHTFPSLADHRDEASLVGHGQGGDRVAHRHLEGSALTVDWTAHDGLDIHVPEHVKRKHPK